MRTLRLILHGKAALEPTLRPAVEAVRESGGIVDVRVTWEVGQAEFFAREAAERGTAVVVAGGGDGTVNDVVKGLLSVPQSTTALAVLPLGTANDFARSLNVPLGDALVALTLAAEGHIEPIDIGIVNDRPFINVASGGFGAEVTAQTPDEWKRLFGGVAYSVAGLMAMPQLTPHPCRLIVDGRSHGFALDLLAVGNGRLAGGGFAVAPQAKFDDGLLDLVIVPDVPLASVPQLLAELFSVSDSTNEHILYRQLAAFELAFEDDFQLNLDGEPLVARRFNFSVLPRRLPVVQAPPPAPA